ncbi:anhydro-N-acetylmuramic acid kinase [Bordetella genomosp. 1]|uniref:Anhydro-N-acetylmuramic acid kinase n=1 Tax=Bordetella genomosp. 1 TaxID=1395607 RepID=A0ABX4F5F1_9BORD|nr:anhydro-N-acetylmuramic acid kinase [Bordetella genomosp. 1]OZI69000.1 anhydro-N-acetylmuramic acid kinase [Bordetella genomosp. 1]
MSRASNGPRSKLPGRCFIGLMSGTSMDGVDGVLMRFAPHAAPQMLASVSAPLPEALRATLMALNTSGPDELAQARLAANELAHVYAAVCRDLLLVAGLHPADVVAVGAHGQTVRHRPDLGYTIQLNAPALLAELCGMDVVADFRSRDVAAGGQGAPLVPPFHAAMFGRDFPRAVLNLGGIANVTLLEPGRAPRGFDTGPANVLLDAWCLAHTGQPFDADGRWAALGRASEALLVHFVDSEPWFALPAPKSTGRDLFGMRWIEKRLASFHGPALRPEDVQATLQRLTARTVADAIAAQGVRVQDLLVCGGGARNSGLMQDLASVLRVPVEPTDLAGVPAQWVEAMAFAWLAQMHVDRLPAAVPEVTGARAARVLGALYPR